MTPTTHETAMGESTQAERPHTREAMIAAAARLDHLAEQIAQRSQSGPDSLTILHEGREERDRQILPE